MELFVLKAGLTTVVLKVGYYSCSELADQELLLNLFLEFDDFDSHVYRNVHVRRLCFVFSIFLINTFLRRNDANNIITKRRPIMRGLCVGIDKWSEKDLA